jgi:hypothetical protein
LRRGKRPPSKRQSDPQANRCKHVDCYASCDRFCYEGRNWDECVRDCTFMSRATSVMPVSVNALNSNPRNYSNTTYDAAEAAE